MGASPWQPQLNGSREKSLPVFASQVVRQPLAGWPCCGHVARRARAAERVIEGRVCVVKFMAFKRPLFHHAQVVGQLSFQRLPVQPTSQQTNQHTNDKSSNHVTPLIK